MVAATQEKTPAVAALEISRLEKRFGEVSVLKSISLAMDEGEFLILVGPSGCGKSTLLNCIAGLEAATSGAIHIEGRDVTQVPPRDRDIAMVFQSYALYPTMTVAENIAFGMKVRRLPTAEQVEKTSSVAKLLQIDHLLDRKPGQLSGGQRQRVAMGRALVRDPKLFLFDEPLSNLDAKLRVEMRGEIKKLHERLGTSIVYVTHDQVEAMTLGTRIVVMKDGAIQQFGTPQEIYDRPANLFVADFMGSPPMNLISASATKKDSGTLITFDTGDGAASYLDKDPPVQLAGLAGREVIAGFRPEALSMTSVPKADFMLIATMVENTGSDLFVTLAAEPSPMIARLPSRAGIKAGDRVALAVEPGSVCYFDPVSTLLLR